MKLNTYVEGIQKEASNRFSNYGGGAIGKLNQFNRTLTFVVTPTTTTAVARAILFGYAYDPTDALQTNCTVTVAESSHLGVKLETGVSPFRIQGLRYFVSTSSSQFANPFSIIRNTVSGYTESVTWQPSSYKNPENNDPLLIIDPSFQLVVTHQDRIEVALNKGESLTVVFYVVDKVNPEQALNGMSAISTTSVGIPTGKTPSPVVMLPASSLTASARGIGGYGNFSLQDELYKNASGDIFGTY